MATQRNYEKMLEQVDEAIAAEFFLEASWIQYAIFEDRVMACIRGAGSTWSHQNIGKRIQKLKEILDPDHPSHEPLVSAQVSGELIDAIFAWKERRNPLIHQLAAESRPWEELDEEAKTLALDGKPLARDLCAAARRIKKHRSNVSL